MEEKVCSDKFKLMMCNMLLRFVSLVTRTTLFYFWPHHFRERSDLSCFQLLGPKEI
jgi:hypothetical protein